MEPSDLATQLGMSSKTLRAWLRRTYPRSAVDHNARWSLTEAQVTAARAQFGSGRSLTAAAPRPAATRLTGGRNSSDEAYVIGMCDETLGEEGRRQHRFDWLLGDPGASGGRVRLPVDAYYPEHNLVVEYRERQHDEPVAHFDKPDRLTVSGVHRGDQRRLYDERREALIPEHGLRLVIIRPSDLAADSRGRLLRHRAADLERVASRVALS